MLQELIDLYSYHRKHGIEETRRKLEYFYKFKLRTLKTLNKNMENLKILDVGCGKTYPFSYIFHLEGSQVTALDTQHIATGMSKYLKMAHYDGFKVSIKSLFRDIRFTPTERKILKTGCNISSRISNIKFVCSSAECMPFADNSFDIVFSFNAFEHIPNINKAVSECARVVKPEGLIYITFHLFTSISGGHHPKWFCPDSDPPNDIPPWFHLRSQWDKYKHQPDYGLNRFSLSDYRNAFKKHTILLNEFTDRIEGRKFLTKDIRHELAQYSEEELLTAFKTILARKNKTTND